ncbi:hypothetical protein BGX27_001474 [Mortierella sp. AM989]|nr:hypothetical protein BGX27_001474 [Mortierella sp. AM989]
MLNRPKGKNLQIQTKFHEQYGKVYTVTVVGFSRVINIRDPEMIDHVLRIKFWKYEKGEFFRSVLAPLIGEGIFGADGQLVVNYFNKITAPLEDSSKTEDRAAVVDLQNIFLLFTLDTFGEVAFGHFPFWKAIEWWTGRDKVIEQDTKIISEFAYNAIRKRRREFEEQQLHESEEEEEKAMENILDDLDVKEHHMNVNDSNKNQKKKINKKAKDLMQLFMDAKVDNGEQLSDEALKDTLLNFVLAGRDTTAQALSWMFYLILRSSSRQEILDKLIFEIDSSLDNGNNNQDGTARPSYDSIKTQKYAEACFYESLRLYPSVPHNIKICTEDDVLPGGTHVYKGELVAWGSWAMGRDTAIWGPDAQEYQPERWLHGEKFSPTNLGQQFATMEAIMITSMLLRNFTMELVDPDKEPIYKQAVTLPMADGLLVRIRRRYKTTPM